MEQQLNKILGWPTTVNQLSCMRMLYKRGLHIILLLIVGCLFNLSSFGQTAQQWASHGEKSFDEEDYYGAAYYYKKAIDIDSTFYEAYYQYAHSLRLYNNYKLAEKTYAHVWDYSESKEFQNALLYWALMEKQNEKYEEAQKHFEQFLPLLQDRKSWEYKKAKQEIQSCQWAIQHLNDSNDTISIKHLGNLLNTFDAEFSPFLLSDSSMLFSSLAYNTKEEKIDKEQEAQFAIRSANKINEAWVADSIALYIEELTEEIGYANPAFSLDSNRLYFTHCDGTNCHIYVSQKMDTAWGKPENIGEAVNIDGYTSTQPFIASYNNLEYLFFVSDRPKTKGGMDIWYSVIKGAGKKYGRAKNLGKKINSPDNELTPFFDGKTKTLYFSSSWHDGYGGYDVFKATGEPKRLSVPSNIGKPYNSPANDLYYSYYPEMELGAMVSNRKGGLAMKGETCCNDIYTINPITPIDTTPKDTPVTVIDTPLLATVTPPSTNQLPPDQNLNQKLLAIDVLPLSVYFENDQPKRGTRPNYASLYDQYLSNINEYRDRNELDRFGLFFNNDLEKGYNDLHVLADSLQSYLQKGFKITLGIRGFTSSLATQAYNEALSLRRINSVKQYLKEYRQGELAQYIYNKQLDFLPYVVGEELSDGVINDNRNDLLSSVYSIGACKARRVEIGWINQQIASDSIAIVQLEKVVFIAKSATTITVNIPIFNPGDKQLEIESLSDSNKNYTIEHQGLNLAAGKKGELEVKIQLQSNKTKIIPLSIQSNAQGNDLPIWIKLTD